MHGDGFTLAPATARVDVSVFPATDLGNAERIVALHGADLRFAAGLGWLVWDGRSWRRDVDGEVMRRAKLTVRSMYTAAAELDDPVARRSLTSWAMASESEARLRAAAKLAETELAVIVSPAQLDTDPMLFNAANGTVELRTGELREHRRGDLLTRIAPAVYDPGARAELWDSFVAKITCGDEELAGFLSRAVGYSMTGYTSEDKIFFAHGPTATGKTSMLEAIKGALGEYVATADFETFLKRRGDAGIRNDIARLDGARLVISVEVDEGKELAEGLVKMLTGGDTVAARFLYRETFEFRPTFTVWLAANARPKVNADDAAMWRRILQVPFVTVIPEGERDERVKIELRTNPDVQSAIVTWAVRGCLEWQRIGLAVPERVLDYTAEYRAENDLLRDWLADCAALAANVQTPVADLRASYETWATENGERPISARDFGTRLRAQGCTPGKQDGRRTWSGIRLHNGEPS